MDETSGNDGFCEWEGDCGTCPIEADECPYQWNGKEKVEVIDEKYLMKLDELRLTDEEKNEGFICIWLLH